VAPVGEMPYKSVTELAMLAGEAESTWLTRLAHELGLFMNPQGRVVGAPLVASHVGGDVAADLVATNLGRQTGTTMLVDIGTNTEIVVSDGEHILVASSPAARVAFIAASSFGPARLWVRLAAGHATAGTAPPDRRIVVS